MGLKPAMGLLLTGRSINAEKALQIGQVNDVVPAEQLLDKAKETARHILKCAPLAIQATKQCDLSGLNENGIAAAMQKQLDGGYPALQKMYRSEDIKEGLNAFVEKQWKGA